MTDYSFSANTTKESSKTLRAKGLVPAVIYGKNYNNQKLYVDKINFTRLYKEAGSSNIVNLSIDEKENEKVLIHDIQFDPIFGNILHIDFFKINMKQKIKTEIPLEFVGETMLVVKDEGSFITNKSEIEVECLPSDLVDHIDIDISGLVDFEQNIKVSDIKVPDGIEILDDPEEVIALIQQPRSEEELEALNEEVVEDVEAVEVEKSGADEEGSEEGIKEDNKEE